eukprot:TRINITY_DN89813_c0_g1_i1.p1 TRINITY_DN89813_c0_g1~~TRINITY_DN89813_c0_g1_i1.p1  ORF type:complete len:471 (+),score=110.46 TRINITY_DN89813_c0_g1_i1:88-1500(+)
MQPARSSAIRVSGREVLLYNDQHFRKIRALHGVPDSFIATGWDLEHDLKKSDAKGGNLMAFIGNDFVVKDLNASDHASLLDIARSYAEHCVSGETLLAPMFLHWHDLETGKNFFAMGNVSGKGPFTALYDLKGCADDKMLSKAGKRIDVVHKRFYNLHLWCGTCLWSDARTTYYEGKVQARAEKFVVTEEQRRQFMTKLQRDIDWLKEAGLMDYSMLVALREGPPGTFDQGQRRAWPFQQVLVRSSRNGQRDEALAVGIIDYLQKWNFSKVIAKKIKFLEPNKATIEPQPYGDRFREHFRRSFIAGNVAPAQRPPQGSSASSSKSGCCAVLTWKTVLDLMICAIFVQYICYVCFQIFWGSSAAATAASSLATPPQQQFVADADAAAGPGFRMLKSGSCAEVGLAPILNSELCAKAAAALNLADITVSLTRAKNRPEGCFWHQGRLLLGRNASNRGNGVVGSRYPICAPQL